MVAAVLAQGRLCLKKPFCAQRRRFFFRHLHRSRSWGCALFPSHPLLLLLLLFFFLLHRLRPVWDGRRGWQQQQQERAKESQSGLSCCCSVCDVVVALVVEGLRKARAACAYGCNGGHGSHPSQQAHPHLPSPHKNRDVRMCCLRANLREKIIIIFFCRTQ